MASDDLVVILPRREAQGLYELLEVGMAPKPQPLVTLKKPRPPVLVELKTVFPTIYRALAEALTPTEEQNDGE